MKGQVEVTTEQLIHIIGLKEVELVVCKAKIQELSHVIQRKEVEERNSKKEEKEEVA